jgi:hypothetical protein
MFTKKFDEEQQVMPHVNHRVKPMTKEPMCMVLVSMEHEQSYVLIVTGKRTNAHVTIAGTKTQNFTKNG